MGELALPIVNAHPIRVNEDGMFNLNDLHKASGGDKKNAPNYWKDSKGVQQVIDLYSYPNSGNEQNQVLSSDRQNGTFAIEQLAIKYAMWISPEFEVQCIKVLMDYAHGKLTTPPLPDNYVCGDSTLVTEYGNLTVAGLPKSKGNTHTQMIAPDFAVKRFSADTRGSIYMKTPAWILDLVKAGCTRILFVTNANNPELLRVKEYVETMILLYGSRCRICLMTDAISAVTVKGLPNTAALKLLN